MKEKVFKFKTATRPEEDKVIKVKLAKVERFVEAEDGGAMLERQLGIVFQINH